MGKSTTAAMFAEAGIPVWDADAAVHRIYAKDGSAVGPLGRLIPDAVIDHAIDRAVLKEKIAQSPEILTQIEAIVHPLVAKDRQQFLADHEDADMVLMDIPLLFETGAETGLDVVVVVTAPAAIQKARVLERPNMTEVQFEAILLRQMPDAEKRAKADFVIETVSLDATRAAVQALIEELQGTHHA